MTDMIVGSQAENADLQSEVARLKAVNKISLMLGTTLDFEAFAEQLIAAIRDYVGCERVILFVPDDQDVALEYSASNVRLPSADKQAALESLQIALYTTDDDAVITKWLAGTPI